MDEATVNGWLRPRVRRRVHLLGTVSGHPSLEDGRWLVTGRVSEIGAMSVIAGMPERCYGLGPKLTGRLPPDGLSALEKAAGVRRVPISENSILHDRS